MTGLQEPNPGEDEQAFVLDPALEAWAQTHLATVCPQSSATLETDVAYEMGLRVGRERFAHEEIRRRRAIAVLSSLAGMAAMGLLVMLLPDSMSPPNWGSGDRADMVVRRPEVGFDSPDAISREPSLRWERLVEQAFETPLSRGTDHVTPSDKQSLELPPPSLLTPVDYRRELGLQMETNNQS